MDTLGKRLQYARKTAHERMGRYEKVTQAELSLFSGISRGTITMVETEQRQSLPLPSIPKIASYLKVRGEWLMTGHGLMIDSPKNKEEVQNENLTSTPRKLSDAEMVGLISEMHGLTGQLIANYSKSLPVERLMNNLKKCSIEFVNSTV